MLGMTGAQLAKEIGQNPSFVSYVENDRSEPGRKSVHKWAKALRIPEDVFLNLVGFATDAQRAEAAKRVASMIGSGLEAVVPVVGPDGEPTGETRLVELPSKNEDAFVLVSDDPSWSGDVVASRTRVPHDGHGVLTMHDGRLRAGYLRKAGHRRSWVEFTDGTRQPNPDSVFVIIRHG